MQERVEKKPLDPRGWPSKPGEKKTIKAVDFNRNSMNKEGNEVENFFLYSLRNFKRGGRWKLI